MEAIVLVSKEDNLLKKLRQEWASSNNNIYHERNKKFNIEFENGRIYVDLDNTIEEDFEQNELKLLKDKLSNSLNFYLISYTNLESLKVFLKSSKGFEGSYIDDDYGTIVSCQAFIDKLDSE